jgi:hypothetical protein
LAATEISQGLPAENAEPGFHHVQPRQVGRSAVKLHLRLSRHSDRAWACAHSDCAKSHAALCPHAPLPPQS